MRSIGYIIVLFLIAETYASEWTNSATIAFANKAGNTNISSFSGNLASSNKGDFRLVGKLLTDSEFSFSANHSQSMQNDTSLIEHKGAIILVFDYHANQKFSPFILKIFINQNLFKNYTIILSLQLSQLFYHVDPHMCL